MKNSVELRVHGRMALFTDPLSRIGGEKSSYHIPTYEALKGVLKSVYWKPTIIWVVDRVRIMKPIQTQSRNVKPLNYGGGNTLAIYTYLADVEYQVQAHFEWNEFRPDMKEDRIEGKHFSIARRMVEKGGRQDVFLGARECQGYVEPCSFGEDSAAYDEIPEIRYGLMFHGFDYPDETGVNELHSRFWNPIVRHGVVEFARPEDCTIRKFVREMIPHPPKSLGLKEEALKNELD
ncbi:MAG: type I-C CRISPR-associated protein Cas5 [Verrucomicrobia bacterium]|nr:type I-C CRISPR-associated protein Cas5 [Nitrospira sp.]MCP5488570.1 type I-C CRISPR-associated protein Cas5 [Verrucomicrobiota bacterium]